MSGPEVTTAGMPLKIKTSESASFEQLCENVEENRKLIPEWIGTKYRVQHNKMALLVSAGLSFTKNPSALKEILEHPNTKLNTTVFCVKHCLPHMQKINLVPDFCVALDPRPLDGISTLGHKREELYSCAHKDTTFLIASMTHHSITKYLLDKGHRVVGWHSACQAMQHPRIREEVKNWVGGGSCSAMRSAILAHIFGFRNIGLLGFDSVVERPDDFGGVDDKGRPKYLKLKINNETLYATPELAAQIQDIENLFKSNADVMFTNYSGGAVAAIINAMGEERVNPPDFLKEIFRGQ